MDPDDLRRMMESHVPFNRFLGMKVEAAAPGEARIVVPFRPELVGDPLRPALHGGVISTLIDAAGGLAVWTRLDHDARVSTIDMRVDYLRPARLESVAAHARVVRAGNRVGVVDVRVFHPSNEEETMATGKAVYNIKKSGPK